MRTWQPERPDSEDRVPLVLWCDGDGRYFPTSAAPRIFRWARRDRAPGRRARARPGDACLVKADEPYDGSVVRAWLSAASRRDQDLLPDRSKAAPSAREPSAGVSGTLRRPIAPSLSIACSGARRTLFFGLAPCRSTTRSRRAPDRRGVRRRRVLQAAAASATTRDRGRTTEREEQQAEKATENNGCRTTEGDRVVERSFRRRAKAQPEAD